MKKTIATILSVLLVLGVIPFFASAGYSLGDVNKDGVVDAADARAVLRVSAKLDKFDESALALSDVNRDGKTDASDARLILRVSAKLETIEEETTEENETEDESKPPVQDENGIPKEVLIFLSGKFKTRMFMEDPEKNKDEKGFVLYSYKTSVRIDTANPDLFDGKTLSFIIARSVRDPKKQTFLMAFPEKKIFCNLSEDDNIKEYINVEDVFSDFEGFCFPATSHEGAVVEKSGNDVKVTLGEKGSEQRFFVRDGKLYKIESDSKAEDGTVTVSAIWLDGVSSDVRSGDITCSGYKKVSVLNFVLKMGIKLNG